MSNGRINILHPDTTALFAMYDKIPSNQNSTEFRNPTQGLWINTPLSDMFFSADNIQYLQYMMKEGVYKMSNSQIKIGNQDEDQLKIIMRGIFLENAQNSNESIKSQVNELNKQVLKFAVPQIYGSAVSYKKYLYDVSNMYKPVNRPILTKRVNQLQLKPWF